MGRGGVCVWVRGYRYERRRWMVEILANGAFLSSLPRRAGSNSDRLYGIPPAGKLEAEFTTVQYDTMQMGKRSKHRFQTEKGKQKKKRGMKTVGETKACCIKIQEMKAWFPHLWSKISKYWLGNIMLSWTRSDRDTDVAAAMGGPSVHWWALLQANHCPVTSWYCHQCGPPAHTHTHLFITSVKSGFQFTLGLL